MYCFSFADEVAGFFVSNNSSPILRAFLTGKRQTANINMWYTQKVATTRFILPCIENTLVDAREAVVARGLRCLAALAGLGLLPKHALPGQAMPAAPLLQHPGIGIRAGAMELCLRAAAALGPVDAQVFLHPVLRPHLRYFSVLGGMEGVFRSGILGMRSCVQRVCPYPPFYHPNILYRRHSLAVRGLHGITAL